MEELDFKALLDRFKEGGFPRGEQVILSNFGTNQTMLSIIFGLPNRLKVLDQREKDSQITRRVALYCGEELVCHAVTKIPKGKNQTEVISDIMAGQLGLGQIVVKHKLPNRRILMDIGHNADGFWRTYAIEGPELYLKIHEYFPRAPFIKVGWLPEMKPNLNYYKSMGGKDAE